MASCKDCVHNEICQQIAGPFNIIDADMSCADFKLRSRFVEFPCKVGDSVFTIDKKENIQKCVVTNVNCKTQMTLDKKLWIDFIIVTEPVDDSLPFPMIFTYSIAKNQILFLTKESAEQALKERENHGKAQ